MGFPPAAERFVEPNDLLGLSLLSDNILLFEIELLTFGVEHVQIVRQAAIVSLGREFGSLARGDYGAIEIFQVLPFGVVKCDRIVNLLDRHQYRLLVCDQEFVRLQIGDIDFRVERAEIKQRPVYRWACRPDQCDWNGGR